MIKMIKMIKIIHEDSMNGIASFNNIDINYYFCCK